MAEEWFKGNLYEMFYIVPVIQNSNIFITWHNDIIWTKGAGLCKFTPNVQPYMKVGLRFCEKIERSNEFLSNNAEI